MKENKSIYTLLMTILLITICISSTILLNACNFLVKQDANKEEKGSTSEKRKSKEDTKEEKESIKNEQEVKNLVKEFGSRLKSVSLLAPKEDLEKSMQENYGYLVDQELRNEWLEDPSNAPGRLTSSPWPDRIEISDVSKTSDDTFEVKGDIIEITSVEMKNGGVAAKRPITLLVKKVDNEWLIVQVTLSPYEEKAK